MSVRGEVGHGATVAVGMARQTGAPIAIAALLALRLTGCLPDRPNDAVNWLRGQAGVTSTEILASDNGEFQSSGIVRGELSPNLDDAALKSLTDSVSTYIAGHPQVGIRVGRNGIDFSVSTDAATTGSAVTLWHSVSGVQHIANAVVRDNSVHARVLRQDAVTVLGQLQTLGSDLTLEAFTDAAAVAADTQRDNNFADNIGNPDSLQLTWATDCKPTPPERALAESFIGKAEIGGGVLALCTSFDLYYAVGASLATFVPALYTELKSANLLELSVTAHQAVGAAGDGHLVTVTPADPAAFAVLSAFEVPGAPVVFYTLKADSSLEVKEYGTPTATLLTLVSASPTAAALPAIRIEGDTSAIDGTLDQLPAMLAQVTALVKASDIFTKVELGPSAGILFLNSPVATDPDVVAAAAALKNSGAWVGRAFQVNYLSMDLTINNGVAGLNDPNYTDPHVLESFVKQWNSGTAASTSTPVPNG